MPSLFDSLWSIIQPSDAQAGVLADMPGHRTIDAIEQEKPGVFLDPFTRTLYQSVLTQAKRHPQNVAVYTNEIMDDPNHVGEYHPHDKEIALSNQLEVNGKGREPGVRDELNDKLRQQPLVHELLHFLMMTKPSGDIRRTIPESQQHEIIKYLLGSPYANDPNADKPFDPKNYPTSMIPSRAHATLQRLLSDTPFREGVWQNPGPVEGPPPRMNPEDHP